jgi:hypothetical protein
MRGIKVAGGASDSVHANKTVQKIQPKSQNRCDCFIILGEQSLSTESKRLYFSTIRPHTQ